MTRFFRIVLPTFSGLSKVSKAISGIMFGFLGFEFWDLSQFYNPHKLKKAKKKAEEKKLYALKA